MSVCVPRTRVIPREGGTGATDGSAVRHHSCTTKLAFVPSSEASSMTLRISCCLPEKIEVSMLCQSSLRQCENVLTKIFEWRMSGMRSVVVPRGMNASGLLSLIHGIGHGSLLCSSRELTA